MPALRDGILCVVVILAVTGCGSGDTKITGDWTGKSIAADGKTTPGANLHFDDEHHWRELYGNLEVQGRWSLSGKKVTLTTELYRGMLLPDAKKLLIESAAKSKNPRALESIAENLDKPMDLTLSDDGKSLEHKDAFMGATTVYTRQ